VRKLAESFNQQFSPPSSPTRYWWVLDFISI